MSECCRHRGGVEDNSLNAEPSLPKSDDLLYQTLSIQHDAGEERKNFIREFMRFTCWFVHLLKAPKMRDTPYSLRDVPGRQARAQKRKAAPSIAVPGKDSSKKKPSKLERPRRDRTNQESVLRSLANMHFQGRAPPTHPFLRLPRELQDRVIPPIEP